MDNNIVYVNLKTKKIVKNEITPQMRKEYIGAIGINAKLLIDSEAIKNDALSEKNVLIFGVGPIVGTGMMAGNRCVVTTKSPITDRYGDSNIGGTFPVRMKGVKIDHLVIQEKSDNPVYILINKNGEVTINDARELWGMDTDKVTDLLIEKHGKGCEVACIGKGGENLIRYSSIIMSKNHAAGRMGTGCVMGSKNLKAIVIENHKVEVDYYNKEQFDDVKRSWLDGSRKSAISHMGTRYGTLFLIEANNRGGGLPIRNFKTGRDSKAENIYPTVFNHDYKVKREACYSCPIGCSKAYKVNEGKFKGLEGSRIEFGAASLGPITGVFDWPGILHMKILCDKYGIDTIEVGAVISLIMEGCERGLVKKEQIFGRDVKFGSVEDAEYLMNLIVNREGIGDDLAEGVYRAANKLGLEKYAFCINKSSTGLQSNGRLVRSLGYLTSTRGGDHLKSFAFTMQNGGYYISKHIFHIKNAKKELGKPINIGRILWWHENYKIIVDCIGVCLFAIQGLPSLGIGMFDDFAKIMNAMYGLNMDEKDVFLAAERIYQIENYFNVSCGLNINDYVWPKREKDDDIDENYLKNTIISQRDEPGMLPEYFKYRGLTKEGKPTEKRFRELLPKEYEKYKCEKSNEVAQMDELLKNVELKIKFNLKDKIHVKLSCFFMDKLFELKDKIEIKKIEKKKIKNNDSY